MKILAFDPGAGKTGWAILEVDAKKQNVKVLDHGVINGTRAKTVAKNVLGLSLLYKDQYLRLQGLLTMFKEVVKAADPDHIVSEAPFAHRFPMVFASLKLVIDRIQQAACEVKRLPVAEYAPKDVKKVVSGKGTADKDAMKKAVSMHRHIIISDKKKFETASEHEIDAIAIGYTFFVGMVRVVEKK